MKHTVRLLAISLSVVSLIGPFKKAEAADSSPSVNTSSSSTTAQSPAAAKVKALAYADMHPELVAQLKSKKGGSIRFWEAVSWCETNHNWNDGGYFSGGLGMAQSVWEGYGHLKPQSMNKLSLLTAWRFLAIKQRMYLEPLTTS